MVSSGAGSSNHVWAALNDALRILVRKAQRQTQPTHGGDVGQPKRQIRRSWRRGRLRCRQTHQRPQASSAGGYFGLGARAWWSPPANTTERDGAKAVLGRVLAWFTWLRLLWVDGGYTGPAFANWVKARRSQAESRSGQTLGRLCAGLKCCPVAGWWSAPSAGCCTIADWCATTKRRSPVPKRWIYIAMIRIQLRRLA